MAKSASKVQGTFSFLDDIEKSEPLPTPKRNTLRPPEQVELRDEAGDSQPPQEQAVSAGAISATPENKSGQSPVAVEIRQQPLAEEQEGPSISKERVTGAEKHKKEKTGSRSADIPPTRLKKMPGTRGRRSVKEYDLTSDQVTAPDDEVLFSKQYYSMGEVTAMLKENHSLIRYWESEFDILKPRKNGKGDRFFRPLDVKNLYLIYDLLRRRKFTIEGAREYLRNQKQPPPPPPPPPPPQKKKNLSLELKANL